MEAVSEVGKREEEYRVVEKETDRLLRWQGGTTRLEVRRMIVSVGREMEGCFTVGGRDGCMSLMCL